MTNHIKYIDTVIKNIKPTNKREIYWFENQPGLGLRVTPKGKKSFVFKYSRNGKSRWLTIDPYKSGKLHEITDKYKKLYVEVFEHRGDPVGEKIEKEEFKKNQLTVSKFLEQYLELGRLRGKTDLKNEEGCFKLNVLPIIGDKPLDEVTPDDIELIQQNILERARRKNKNNKNYARRGGRGAVYHTLAYTRQLFNLAMKRGKVSSNPVEAIDSIGEIKTRTRVLDFTEIWLFWNRIDKIGLPFVTASALKFILATMQRGIEVRNMRYAAHKENENVWHMEMEETKNRSMHRVPLNKYALEIIAQVEPFTYACPYVFGATRALFEPNMASPNLVPLGDTALSQALRKKRDELNIEDIKPHDLRRTAATWITAVGLPKMYAQLMLNHKEKKSDTTGMVYVQYSYDFEKRRAVDVWAYILDQIVTCKSEDEIPTLDELRDRVRNAGLV